MKFTRLRLLGFKSFVEPAEFVIERGLTGVVGPNGCGKSNLVEALRWVMGESSYKNMRASGMDDVIFSGSGTRPARNTAEVTLFLDNADRTAPATFNDADELQVSRRIEREAGSVYRINGKEARAKDVQLLFADQSTGARSPSMVGQGRIGELIQAKPQARRALLEEAAGISGLHTRRHEAELRLRAAEQNLERLDDVVGELESQIENLKRQARQASRFKNLSADIRKAEATLLHLRWTLAKAHEARGAVGAGRRRRRVVAERASRPDGGGQGAGGRRASPAGTARRRGRRRRRLPAAVDRQVADRGGGSAHPRAARPSSTRRLEQLDADIAREEQMLRDNADVLAAARRRRSDACQPRTRRQQSGRARRVPLSRHAAAALTRRAKPHWPKLTAERAEATAARQPVRARLARKQPSGATALRGSSPTIDREAAEIAERRSPRSPIRPKSALLSIRRRRRWAAEAAACRGKGGRRGARRRERRAPAGAGGECRAGAHRDRSAHAGEDPQCRGGGLFPAVLEQINGRARL